jgi:hypothetical protein
VLLTLPNINRVNSAAQSNAGYTPPTKLRRHAPLFNLSAITLAEMNFRK